MLRSELQIRDPFILVENGKYYLLGSTGNDPWNRGSDLILYVSKDLENFEPVTKLVEDTYFEGYTNIWAPELHKYQGKYYLIVSLRQLNSKKRGSMIFVSDSLTGNYRPLTGEYITPKYMNCIDATLFEYKGKPYLCFSNEWIDTLTNDGDGALYIEELSNDLKEIVGRPRKIVSAKYCGFSKKLAWKDDGGYVAEGPYMFLQDDEIVLLWSTFTEKGYCVVKSVAEKGAIGEYKTEKLLVEADGGHCMSFVDLSGNRKLIFHQPNNTPNERAQIYDYADLERNAKTI